MLALVSVPYLVFAASVFFFPASQLLPQHNPFLLAMQVVPEAHRLIFVLICTVSFETLSRHVCLSKSCPEYFCQSVI